MTNQEFDQALLGMVPEAAPYLKDTGCLKCDLLPGDELCIDCRLEQADADVVQAMSRREELERKKEKQNEQKTIRRNAQRVSG